MKRKPLWSTLIVTLMLISLTTFAQEVWKGSEGREKGWKHYTSFGWFWSESRSSMEINHADHGVMHAVGSFEKGVWLHDSELGWIWTSRAEYPNLFSTTRGSWLFNIVGSLSGTIVEVNRFLSGLDPVKIASDYIYSSPLIVLVTLPGHEFQLINWLTDLSFVKSATLNVLVFAANEAAQTTKDMLFSF